MRPQIGDADGAVSMGCSASGWRNVSGNGSCRACRRRCCSHPAADAYASPVGELDRCIPRRGGLSGADAFGLAEEVTAQEALVR